MVVSSVTMIPPQDEETCTSRSQERLVESNNRKFWSRRSGLEKGLLAALAACGLVLVAGGVFVASRGGLGVGGEEDGQTNEAGVAHNRQDVCVTPECAIAGT